VTLAWLWIQLIASTAIILLAATHLTRAVEIVAKKTGLGRSFVGVLMLATATSLPEMGTGASSVLLDEPDIAIGAVFGSNLFNLVIIVFLDIAWRRGAILGAVSQTSTLVAWLGVGVISLGSVAVMLPHYTGFGAGWSIAPMSMLILGFFVVSMWAIYKSDLPMAPAADRGSDDHDMSLRRASWTYATAALVVIGASIWLAHTGDGLVERAGLQASFVGTLFLALCTSLPEVATSFAALRMGAPDLAVTNVLGSNLFNMGFVVVLNDGFLTRGSIWSEVSRVHAFTGAVGVLMTLLVVYGLRQRGPTRRFGTVECVGLLLLYIISSIVVYRAG